eukprot:2093262-Amphidinium_carterae.1
MLWLFKSYKLYPRMLTSTVARMVCVVKPAVRDDGSRFVKRKSRLLICGNFLNPYGETFTANLDVSVLRGVVTVGMNNGWRFASVVTVGMNNGWKFALADIPQAFLYASIEEGRHVYLRPSKICVDFGLARDERSIGLITDMNNRLE